MKRGSRTEIVRVSACVAVAALLSILVPHVASVMRFVPGESAPAEMPMVVRWIAQDGAKQRVVTRHGDLTRVQEAHPEASLILDMHRGRIELEDGRYATFEVEEFPKGQIITLELHEPGEYTYATYRVEGGTISPIALRVVRADETTYLLLAALVAALALGRFRPARRRRPATA